ncbi:hypothetical protein HOV56_gp23 [Nitrosopumilus spindle-shaped virus]|uniref:Uncharacterized protein n=2 Tax=Nitmarvirus NSV1 TaxID=2734593 RepID=A0A514K2V4_9VIRU|nr:hypothetical protein HOV56_gp23 [Nitrosopumilus spindle-shaped virus]YP_010772852.1 hypothetical protein QIT54_gp22 [Nitrosopumilus spindle-shaped virus]YP_010772900.1 hypothetical protein QIT55_gp22 [Nitrosopumilus spindle-shaped virus]QDI73912.1 hypothetical protein [Nitrosopumilus spindle-shaped virus]QDI73960.1 hypothetical protein [Nitrosopumilus spindle-shaped virus]QDI74008.1 hypothetical protein [Nitrosopumilus spindle-shaped virus]
MSINQVRDSDSFVDFSQEMVYPGLDKLYQMPIQLKNKKWKSNQDRKIITAHRVLESLVNTCDKRGLPRYYAFETMRRLLKINKYLYSYRHQIIELISVLQDTNDVRLKNHIDYFCKEVDYVKRIF